MQLLKIIRHSDLFLCDGPKDLKEFEKRKAARAAVFDNEKNIAILKVGKHNYHKLPGGGVEEGENLAMALAREILEEIGCKISVVGEVGKIIEYRDKWNLEQESYCYLAKLVSKKGQSDFTKEEKENGFAVLWVSLNEAIEKIKKDQPDDYEGKFIKARDLCFLEEAKKMLE